MAARTRSQPETPWCGCQAWPKTSVAAPAGDSWEIIWAHYRPRKGWPDPLTWPAVGAGVARVAAPSVGQRGRIEQSLLETDAFARSSVHRGMDLAMNALERSLLWLDSASPHAHQLDDRIQEAVMFIARHLDHAMTVGTIAEEVHLSPSRLAHLFTRQVGTSPARFVELKRIERAQELLESSSLPIRAVAEATGFSSQFYFATRFRALTGIRPSDWRRPAWTVAPRVVPDRPPGVYRIAHEIGPALAAQLQVDCLG